LSVPNAEGYMSIRENTYLNYPPHHVSWWSLKTFLYISRELKLDLLDYHAEKLESLSHFTEVLFKRRVNRLLGRENKLIRLGVFDRFVSAVGYQVGRLLPSPSVRISPNGHSITVVLRKANA